MENASNPLILMIGLNHKVAPVDVRERLAFNAERVPRVLDELLDRGGENEGVIKEAVVLSTCNRTEVYIQADDLDLAEARLLQLFARQGNLMVEQLRSMGYGKRGEEAALHLMEVAAGLDSLVLGENEILGQVRCALEMAQEADTSGTVLSTLFRHAIRAGKRVRNETGIGREGISVAGVVVELAEQALGPLNDRTALLIGAGKISSITARGLAKAGLRCILVANRTFEHARKLAQNLNGTAVHFDALDENLTRADIVICSTGAPHLVLHAESVVKAQAARGNRPLLVVDLAVPRDADPQIASIPNVRLANIDDLANVVTSHPLSVSFCLAAETIVQQEVENFHQWCRARRCAPVIQAMYAKAERISEAEVESVLRRMGPLTPHQRELMKGLGRSIANKLLHEPTVYLRELPSDKDVSSTLEVFQELYGSQ